MEYSFIIMFIILMKNIKCQPDFIYIAQSFSSLGLFFKGYVNQIFPCFILHWNLNHDSNFTSSEIQ